MPFVVTPRRNGHRCARIATNSRSDVVCLAVVAPGSCARRAASCTSHRGSTQKALPISTRRATITVREAARPSTTCSTRCGAPSKRSIGHSAYRDVDRPGGSAFDIGCGMGGALVHLRSRGWQVSGIEPDAELATVARDRFGLEVETGLFGDDGSGDGELDFAYSCHMFEHFDRPVRRRPRRSSSVGGSRWPPHGCRPHVPPPTNVGLEVLLDATHVHVDRRLAREPPTLGGLRGDQASLPRRCRFRAVVARPSPRQDHVTGSDRAGTREPHSTRAGRWCRCAHLWGFLVGRRLTRGPSERIRRTSSVVCVAGSSSH